MIRNLHSHVSASTNKDSEGLVLRSSKLSIHDPDWLFCFVPLPFFSLSSSSSSSFFFSFASSWTLPRAMACGRMMAELDRRGGVNMKGAAIGDGCWGICALQA